MVEIHELAAAADLAGFLRSFAGTTARLHQRSAPCAAVTLQVAAADEAAAELWRWGKREQEKDIRAVLRLLVNRGWLSQTRVDDVVDASPCSPATSLRPALPRRGLGRGPLHPLAGGASISGAVLRCRRPQPGL